MGNNFSKNILKMRTRKGLSQKELAEKAGISAQEIIRIETGKVKNPTLFALAYLSQALEVTVDELVYGEAE